eukprot:jgi/Mesvir1/24876/Mv22107-RA.1
MRRAKSSVWRTLASCYVVTRGPTLLEEVAREVASQEKEEALIVSFLRDAKEALNHESARKQALQENLAGLKKAIRELCSNAHTRKMMARTWQAQQLRIARASLCTASYQGDNQRKETTALYSDQRLYMAMNTTMDIYQD